MEKDIFISIKSIQNSPDGELIQNTGPFCGQYFYKDGFHYCLYEEILEGVDHPVKSRIKFSSDVVTLHKSGDVNFDATYEIGKDYLCNYHTMFGPICMKIRTNHISVRETDNRLTLSLQYDSVMAEDYATSMDMEITITNK